MGPYVLESWQAFRKDFSKRLKSARKRTRVNALIARRHWGTFLKASGQRLKPARRQLRQGRIRAWLAAKQMQKSAQNTRRRTVSKIGTLWGLIKSHFVWVTLSTIAASGITLLAWYWFRAFNQSSNEAPTELSLWVSIPIASILVVVLLWSWFGWKKDPAAGSSSGTSPSPAKPEKKIWGELAAFVGWTVRVAVLGAILVGVGYFFTEFGKNTPLGRHRATLTAKTVSTGGGNPWNEETRITSESGTGTPGVWTKEIDVSRYPGIAKWYATGTARVRLRTQWIENGQKMERIMPDRTFSPDVSEAISFSNPGERIVGIALLPDREPIKWWVWQERQ